MQSIPPPKNRKKKNTHTTIYNNAQKEQDTHTYIQTKKNMNHGDWEVVLSRSSWGEEGAVGETEADNVLESSGLTSVTSSMPSSKYTTSCILSWWYSTISLKKRFSRAYSEFSLAKRAFSANSDSSWRRIWSRYVKNGLG